MKDFAVIGLGRFGSSVARSLHSLGRSVLGVDKDEAIVNAASEFTTKAVQCDATDEQSLRALGLRNVDVVVVALGDLQASILVTLFLKEIGVHNVIAKAANEHHGKVLTKIGADRVVFPEQEMGKRVAHNLASSTILDLIELSPQYSIVELAAGKRLVGRNLQELDLRNRYGINVIGIRRGKDVNLMPKRDDVILHGDVLIIVGENGAIKNLEDESR